MNIHLVLQSKSGITVSNNTLFDVNFIYIEPLKNKEWEMSLTVNDNPNSTLQVEDIEQSVCSVVQFN